MNIPSKHHEQIFISDFYASAVILLFCMACILCLGGCNPLKHEKNLDTMKQYRFKVNDIPINCWVACDINQHRHGLRGHAGEIVHSDTSETRHGMCFVYPSDRILVFTMKDVSAPLEVAFLSASGILLHIESMRPDAQKLYSWKEPAMFALELAPGTLEEAGLKPGHRLFSPADRAALKALCSGNAP